MLFRPITIQMQTWKRFCSAVQEAKPDQLLAYHLPGKIIIVKKLEPGFHGKCLITTERPNEKPNGLNITAEEHF